MDVKHLCLGVLSMGDATGYDIKKYFEQSFANFFVAGYGSIYPALADLLANDYVTCREQAQEKLPDKKIYSITDAGRGAFEDALLHAKPRHKVRSEFLVLMYFAHLLPPEKVAAHLRQRVAELDEIIEVIESNARDGHPHLNHPGVEFCAGYGLAMSEGMRDYAKAAGDKLLTDIESFQSAESETVADNVVEMKRA